MQFNISIASNDTNGNITNFPVFYDYPFDDYHVHHYHVLPLIYIIVLAPSCLFGIVLNVVGVVALSKEYQIKRSTRFLLFMIAAADILFLTASFVSLTTSIVSIYAVNFEQMWSPVIQVSVVPIILVASLATLWTVVTSVGEQYLTIFHPALADKYMNKSSLWFTAAAVWIYPLISYFPFLFQHLLVKTEDGIQIIQTQFSANHYFVELYAVCQCILPLAVLSFFVHRLIGFLRTARGFDANDVSDGHVSTDNERDWTKALVVSAIVLLVLQSLCRFLHIFMLALDIAANFEFYLAAMWVPIFSFVLIIGNSSVKFAVYAKVNVSFRRTLVDTLCCRQLDTENEQRLPSNFDATTDVAVPHDIPLVNTSISQH